jgi:DNA-binding MarR family transcriptional regulator
MSTTGASPGPAADILDAMLALHRALARAAAAAFSETGVGTKQVQILREIRGARRVSQVELSRATSTDPAGLMRALEALERRGWVQRVGCEDDRRRKLVSLTPEGQRAMTLLDAHYESLRKLTHGSLKAAERRQFCALVAKVALTLEAAAAIGPDGEAG